MRITSYHKKYVDDLVGQLADKDLEHYTAVFSPKTHDAMEMLDSKLNSIVNGYQYQASAAYWAKAAVEDKWT